MSNDVFEVARTVMAVRDYQEEPIPDDALRRIVEAGRVTGSAANRQPWHFVLVRERDSLRKLGSLVRTGPYIANATAAVIVAYEKASHSGVSDASRAIQSMLIVAWGDGVGSNWTGLTGIEAVRQGFGIPDTFDVLAVLPFGYPKRKVIGRKKRKPFNEVVSAERFGTPLA
jgi:nitroreductase